MSEANCNECRFFHVAFGDRLGSCRRYPIFQNRSMTEWCGEFQSKMVSLPVVDLPQVEKKKPGRPKKEVQDVQASE